MRRWAPSTIERTHGHFDESIHLYLVPSELGRTFNAGVHGESEHTIAQSVRIKGRPGI